METVEVVVDSVRVHEETKQHTVLPREREGQRVLPIWIGPDQAHAISSRLYDIANERPMTHDLIVQLSQLLHARFERLVIRGLQTREEGKSAVFLASVFVRSADGAEGEIDCRPSDGVALAVRTGMPIFVADSVFVANAVVPT